MARAMPHLPHPDRRTGQRSSAAAEDRGLFKRPVVQLPVALSAVMYRNRRNDLIFTGYTGSGPSFDVVLAGRRALLAAPLVNHVAQMRVAAEKAALRTGKPFGSADVRVPVVLDGAWRTRVWQDEKGWQLKVHQLVVAQWRFGEAGTESRVFGIPPIAPED